MNIHRKYATTVPKNTDCAKCGRKIEPGNNDGRRFRMKWRCKDCIPQTRKNKINGGLK